MNATIATNKIAVIHTVRQDVDREFLIVDVPCGWDDVRPLTRKVLTYDGRDFTFTGWNSDTFKCYFVRPLNGKSTVAEIR